VSALGIILLQLVTAQEPKDLRKNVLSKLGDIIRFQGKSMERFLSHPKPPEREEKRLPPLSSPDPPCTSFLVDAMAAPE
jgi:hypothetical protein